MSTKTSFKRIALVAVAALGFGLLSVAPSNAASLQKITVGSVAGVQTTTGTTNVAVTTLVNFNGYCDSSGPYAYTNYQTVYSALPTTSKVGMPAFDALAYNNNTYSQLASWYAPASSGVGEGQVLNDGQNTNVGGANFIHMACGATGRYNTYGTISFTPDVAGTYSLLIQDPTQAYTQTTWTIVVTDPTVKLSTAFLNTTLGSASIADATAANLTFTAAASTTAKARLDVKQYSTTDTTTAAVAAITKDVVVAISKGLVSKTNDYSAGSASVTEAGGVSGAIDSDYYVFANGTVGAASLTVTVGGVLVSTKAIVFNGVATTLAAVLTSGQKTWIAPTQTTTLTVSSKDSAGNASTNTPTITATSSATAVATVVATSNTLVTITGVAAGTAVITIADSATTSPATSVTYTVTVKAATTTAAATMTFDKTDYAPGELMTITIAADVADNASYAAFTANPVTNVQVVTVLNPFTTGAVALVAGKATWTAYAPASGNVTVTATSSAGPTTAVAVTATANVTNAALDQATAATDAAAEATDAANAATDAANAAAEAADAATAAAQDAADAVAALSTSVAAMIDALKKQITALTNLVIKIQKKVKA